MQNLSGAGLKNSQYIADLLAIYPNISGYIVDLL